MNVWLTNEMDRRVAAAADQFKDYELLLRPTRRFVFVRNYKLGTYLPEFFKPCLGVLCRKNDPDKKPCMVIETDRISDELKSLYAQHGILWVSIFQENNKFVLECVHRGMTMRIHEASGNLYSLLAGPLALDERNISFPQGAFVHSYHERLLHKAVEELSTLYRIKCHHQVPVSYVLGKQNNLTREELDLIRRGGEIDAVITHTYNEDPDYTVVLPIKLDIHNSHFINKDTMRKDLEIKKLFEKYNVPLLIIKPGEGNSTVFICSVLYLPTQIAFSKDPKSWGKALAPFLGSAIQRKNMS